jgi:hypothetical protein
MGKSSSKSKSSSNTTLPAGQTAAMNAQVGASTPVLQLLAQQLMEALSTGNVGARIPLMQRAVEASKNATATQNQQVNSRIAQGGVTGPFANAMQSGTAQQGAFGVSQAGPQMIQSLLALMPDFGLMRGSGVFGGSAKSGTSSESKTTPFDFASLFKSAQKLGGLFSPSTDTTGGGGIDLGGVSNADLGWFG